MSVRHEERQRMMVIFPAWHWKNGGAADWGRAAKLTGQRWFEVKNKKRKTTLCVVTGWLLLKKILLHKTLYYKHTKKDFNGTKEMRTVVTIISMNIRITQGIG